MAELPCEHPKILVTPNKIEKSGDGVIIKDLYDSAVICQMCKASLESSIIDLYDQDNISVGIPTDLVD